MFPISLPSATMELMGNEQPISRTQCIAIGSTTARQSCPCIIGSSAIPRIGACAALRPPNGLAFSCRERASRCLQKPNDLAREAVNCNAGLGAPASVVRLPPAANHTCTRPHRHDGRRSEPRPSGITLGTTRFAWNHAHLGSRFTQRAFSTTGRRTTLAQRAFSTTGRCTTPRITGIGTTDLARRAFQNRG